MQQRPDGEKRKKKQDAGRAAHKKDRLGVSHQVLCYQCPLGRADEAHDEHGQNGEKDGEQETGTHWDPSIVRTCR